MRGWPKDRVARGRGALMRAFLAMMTALALWSAPARAAASGPRAPAAPCAYADLDAGLFEPLFGYEDVTSVEGGAALLVQNAQDDHALLFDLRAATKTRIGKAKGEFAFFSADSAAREFAGRRIAMRPAGAANAVDPADIGAPVAIERLVHDFRPPAGPRAVKVARIFSGQFGLKIYPADIGKYEALRADLARGRYCGADLARAPRGAAMTARAVFALWDDLTESRLWNFAEMEKRKALLMRLDEKRRSAFVDAYCFRLTEFLQFDPAFTRVDPAKLWNFVWAPVAKMLRDKDWTQFSDAAAYLRDGVVTFSLLATDRIEGAERNEYGFYLRELGARPVADIGQGADLRWRWRHDGGEHEVKFHLATARAPGARALAAFPSGAASGALVLDGTLSRKETRDMLARYVAYFRKIGFVFAPDRPTRDMKAAVMAAFDAAPTLDYLIRDGHADGEDNNLFVLRKIGSIAAAERTSASGRERLTIFYSMAPKSKKTPLQRVSHEEFARTRAATREGAAAPLVHLDTSCWGFEKLKTAHGFVDPAKVMQIGAVNLSNFFLDRPSNATRIIIDAIRAGRAFEEVRRAMAGNYEYRNAYADGYVFPGDRLDLDAAPGPRIERTMTRKENGVVKPYVPEGYL